MTTAGISENCLQRYARLLGQFPAYAAKGVHQRSVGPRTFNIFGSGNGDENGMRTLGSFAFTSALLASHDGVEPTGATRDQLLDWARSAIGYMCATHRSSSESSAGGVRWGHQWQSAWWATRMALGARLIWDRLDDVERSAVRALIISEADRFIGVPARTGLFRDTKAEENAWDSEILAVACAMCSDHANAAAWRKTLIDYALNAISAPQDRTSEKIVDGRSLAGQVYTTNVHSDFTVENHGPHHFCYVASPLHSLTWGHYALRSAGIDVPQAQTHNVRAAWDRAVTMFLDNRFAYPGGQDWARYTYGTYFIQPVAAMLARLEGDEIAATIERLRLDRLEQEQTLNGDGSFFGRRVTRGILSGQMGKYETDCFANVGLAYLIHKNASGDAPAPLSRPELRRRTRATHISPEGALCYARTERLFASFCWDSLAGPYPIALFVPDGCDDLCEWTEGNLLGSIVTRHEKAETLPQRRMIQTERGFQVEGRFAYRTKRGGWRYDHDLLVELLEDEGILIVENRFRARQKLFVAGGCGMRWFVPNDLFNDCRRQVHTSTGETIELVFDEKGAGAGAGGRADRSLAQKLRRAARKFGVELWQDRRPIAGNWINVDDRIGIVRDGGGGAGGKFSVVRETKRNAPWSSLYCERIELGAIGPRRVDRGRDILSSRYLVIDGDRRRTAEVAANLERYRAYRLRAHEQIQ